MKERPLNLGFVAHADAGKTTLTEQILFCTGAIRRVGSVDDGTASTDSLGVEKERGISVRSAGASVEWKGVRLNLIDAPGHADFLSEVERSLSVLDAAVLVVSAAEGVQPQTRLLIEAVRRAKLPCFVFLNKCDRAGSRSAGVLAELEPLFGVSCLLLSGIKEEGTDRVSAVPFAPGSSELLEAGVMACGDDGLLERFLTSEEEAACLLPEAIGKAAGEGKLVPVICGASKFGTGVKELLDALTGYLKAPAPAGEGFCARVFKIEHDPAMGKAAYVRLFSGALHIRETVFRDGQEAGKAACIRRFQGRKLEDVPCVEAGETAVLYGLPDLRAGDLLGEAQGPLREYSLSQPLMLSRVTAADPAQAPALAQALRELCDEDPALGLEWNREKREAWVRVTGRIQLEVLETMLLERWDLRASFEPPSVIYRETPVKAAEGFEAYLAPKPCWAVVRLLIEPLPPGSGVEYESRVTQGTLAIRYQNHVETAVYRALSQGLYGWEVTDLKVTLIDGGSHHFHTHPLDFFVAAPMALMNGLENAGTKLLEPILRMELAAPEEYLGKTIGLLTARRGEFESPRIESGSFRLSVLIPAAETFDFPAQFAAATAGSGVCGSRLSHYAPCPEGMGGSRERIGPDPRDRTRYILAARSALTEGE